MNKKNVYIGFDKENNRCLLYKNDDTYINLETKKKVDEGNLQKNTLLPYEKLIEHKGLNLKNIIIKNYKKDCEEDIPIDDVYTGSVLKVKTIYNVKESEKTFNLTPFMQYMALYCGLPFFVDEIRMPETVTYRYSYDIVAKDILLQRLPNRFSEPDYKCLLLNKTIKHKDGILQQGDLIVSETMNSFRDLEECRNISEYCIEMPKKKVMELYMKDKYQ